MESFNPKESLMKSEEGLSSKNSELKIMRVHDADLKMKGLVTHKTLFQPVAIDDSIIKKAKTSDIQQRQHNNCFLLSILSSILQNNPTLISKIVTVRPDKNLQFTFYDPENLNKKYIYIIDPSIVNTPSMNSHTNPLVFMFEKCFVIHRLTLQEEKLNQEQKQVLQAWRSHEFDDTKTINYLAKNESDILRAKAILKEVKEVCVHQDYHAALQKGYAHEVFAMFFGSESQVIEINNHHNVHYMTNDFLNLICAGDIDKNVHEILTSMFGSIDSEEAKYFQECLKKTEWESLVNLHAVFDNLNPSNKQNKHELLKQAFAECINWLPCNDNELKIKTLKSIDNFIDNEISYKRGLGLYTISEQKYYQAIFNALQSKSFVTTSTPAGLGKDQIAIKHKGLYDKHEYSVVNCYEKNGRKYIVLYNPHGRNERDYKEDENKRLHAMARESTEQPTLKKLLSLSFLSKSIDVQQPALPLGSLNIQDSGFFELELTDLSQNFYKISISGPTSQLTKVKGFKQ